MRLRAAMGDLDRKRPRVVLRSSARVGEKIATGLSGTSERLAGAPQPAARAPVSTLFAGALGALHSVQAGRKAADRSPQAWRSGEIGGSGSGEWAPSWRRASEWQPSDTAPAARRDSSSEWKGSQWFRGEREREPQWQRVGEHSPDRRRIAEAPYERRASGVAALAALPPPPTDVPPGDNSTPSAGEMSKEQPKHRTPLPEPIKTSASERRVSAAADAKEPLHAPERWVPDTSTPRRSSAGRSSAAERPAAASELPPPPAAPQTTSETATLATSERKTILVRRRKHPEEKAKRRGTSEAAAATAVGDSAGKDQETSAAAEHSAAAIAGSAATDAEGKAQDKKSSSAATKEPALEGGAPEASAAAPQEFERKGPERNALDVLPVPAQEPTKKRRRKETEQHERTPLPAPPQSAKSPENAAPEREPPETPEQKTAAGEPKVAPEAAATGSDRKGPERNALDVPERKASKRKTPDGASSATRDPERQVGQRNALNVTVPKDFERKAADSIATAQEASTSAAEAEPKATHAEAKKLGKSIDKSVVGAAAVAGASPKPAPAKPPIAKAKATAAELGRKVDEKREISSSVSAAKASSLREKPVAEQETPLSLPDNGAVAIFDIGGRTFSLAAKFITAWPGTQLAQLVRSGTPGAPICVDAPSDRFAYILDWYRYGEIYVPQGVSVAAVLQDARVLQLPEDLVVNGTVRSTRPNTAERVGRQLIDLVIRRWHGYRGFFSSTLTKIDDHFQSLAVDDTGSDEAYDFQPFIFPLFGDDVWLSTDVCSGTRARVLALKLEERGYLCQFSETDLVVSLPLHLRGDGGAFDEEDPGGGEEGEEG